MKEHEGSKQDDVLDRLYQAVQTRPRPEDVAEIVIDALGPSLTKTEALILERVAVGSLRRLRWSFSSMASDFFRPVTQVNRTLATGAKLFGIEPEVMLDPGQIDLDAERMLAWVRMVGEQVGKVIGKNDFRTDRWRTKVERRAHGVYKNARWVNKRWRLLKRIEVKIARYAWAQSKYRATRVGKSGLATLVSREAIVVDMNTACLAAYLSARMSLRSVFTNTKQARAFDEVSDLLLTRCERSKTTRWDVLACLSSTERITQHLTDEQKGNLVGRWWASLSEFGEMLQDCWLAVGTVDRSTMIVKRGVDSSTWNQTALAWNTARANWIGSLTSLGMGKMLDVACPGKVMRLMAADVAYWHRASGKDVHPDTIVWAELPLPWDVLAGRAECTREMVERACTANKVDPSTWLASRKLMAVAFTPTPELVHGVAVASPALAERLRRAGWFSGKGLKDATIHATVVRDAHGAALFAREPMEEPNRALAQD